MNNVVRKILNIALKIGTGILVAFTVFMMLFTVTTVTTVDKNDRNLLGFKFYIVRTDSMSPTEENAHLDVHFVAGDIVIIKNVKDPTSLQPGDVIAFLSTNSVSYGETVTHMIREAKTNGEGKLLGYVTYGTATNTDDEALVEPEYVLGQYAGKLPKVGLFFAFVKSTPGYIVCILVPFLLLILYNGINVIRLFRKYKKEQMAEMNAEREKLEQERQESQRMMAELLELKAQLAKQQEEGTPQPPAPEQSQASDAPAQEGTENADQSKGE